MILVSWPGFYLSGWNKYSYLLPPQSTRDQPAESKLEKKEKVLVMVFYITNYS